MTMTAHSAPFNIATHNGIITILNPATGEHRTVKISTAKGGTRWVYILSGPNNESDWTSFGRIKHERVKVFRRLSCDGFYDSLANILNCPAKFVGRLEFMFEGKCRKCNRRLTNPESIESGIGPECRKNQL
jgi:hypothetical protein